MPQLSTGAFNNIQNEIHSWAQSTNKVLWSTWSLQHGVYIVRHLCTTSLYYDKFHSWGKTVFPTLQSWNRFFLYFLFGWGGWLWGGEGVLERGKTISKGQIPLKKLATKKSKRRLISVSTLVLEILKLILKLILPYLLNQRRYETESWFYNESLS